MLDACSRTNYTEMLSAGQTVRKMLTARQNAFYSKTKRMITTEQNAKIQPLSFRRKPNEVVRRSQSRIALLRCLQQDKTPPYSSTKPKTQRLSFRRNLAMHCRDAYSMTNCTQDAYSSTNWVLDACSRTKP